MTTSIYLDNNATTRPLEAVNEIMQSTMSQQWGNPSSIHRIGQEARQLVDLAREQVAKLINANPSEITFTSGGTEAANLALHSACQERPDRKLIITSQIEHAAVAEMADALCDRGIEVIRINNDEHGVMSMQELETLLQDRANEIAVVSLMWCNNETGVIEPIEKASLLCKKYDVLLHSDGTQWVAKMPVDVRDVQIDFLSFASHKFHGPKGIGAIYTKEGIVISPLVLGGPQERRRRGGTENVPAIAGFGVASEAALSWLNKANVDLMIKLRDDFEMQLKETIPQIKINSSGAPRAWTTSSVAFPEIKGELLLLMLSERGVYASSGSACSSGAFKESAVIAALGDQDGEWGTVRFSFARTTTHEELSQAVQIISEATQKALEVMASTA
ncbi:MAG: cysteine desulfurase [Phycisphaerae bacterium]|jgi:cysteine desulfurase|nr:cysteine desulfurase [Phycisphaerae bacterium]HJN71739.1 cysteine desulfurase family protein [Phycisphaerales bacterium]